MSTIETSLKKKQYRPEIIALAAYASLLAIMMVFHEPWFDEAQAWLIARDAGIRELLASITHYEGHPPLWFLILMPLAKLGVPFEIGIKSVNFVFAATAMGLLIFRAPFNRLVRCVIPFTYFFFYQYGVISRPYSMMLLGFVLCAIFYRTRNEKPLRFTAAIALICASSAYGMVISAGIALVWTIEILREKVASPQGPFLRLIRDRRIWTLIVLFVFNIIQAILIMPFGDTFGTNFKQENPLINRIFYMLFLAPADAVCSSSFFSDTINISLDVASICAFALSMLILSIILAVTWRSRKIALFLIPFGLLALFGGSVYFSPHHVGIFALFFLFIFWCSFDAQKKDLRNFTFKSESDRLLLLRLSKVVLGLILLTSVYWSAMSGYHDIINQYGTGREAAAFLKTYHLDQLNIMTAWSAIPDKITGTELNDFNYTAGTNELAYFDKNIFTNFNNGENKGYIKHRVNHDDSQIKTISEQGYPDVLLGFVDLKYLYGSAISLEDYALVLSVHGNTIWKDRLIAQRQYVFIRRDLLPQYPELHELNIIDEMVLCNKINRSFKMILV